MRRVLLISEVALLAQDIAANPPMWASDHNTTGTSKKRSIQSASPAGAGWLFDNYNYRGNNNSKINDDDEEDNDDSVDEGEENIRKNSDLYEIAEATDDEDDDEKLRESSNDLKESQAKVFCHKALGFRGHFKLPTKRADNHQSMKNLLSDEERQEIEKLLGEWQEPEIKKKTSVSTNTQRQNMHSIKVYIAKKKHSFVTSHFELAVEGHFSKRNPTVQRDVEFYG